MPNFKGHRNQSLVVNVPNVDHLNEIATCRTKATSGELHLSLPLTIKRGRSREELAHFRRDH